MMIKKIIKSEKQQRALNYALDAIQMSTVADYINSVYLFGSCARGEEKWTSDVDLFIELSDDLKQDQKLKKELRLLKSIISSDELNDAETDLKFVYGDEWRKSTMTFYRKIREEGIKVWP